MDNQEHRGNCKVISTHQALFIKHFTIGALEGVMMTQVMSQVGFSFQ